MAVPLALGAVLIAVLLSAQRRRWFSRFPNGVFISVACTMVTIGLISAAIVGTWGYGAARRIMRAEMTVSLDSIASIIQGQIDLEIQRGTLRLTGLTKAVAPALRPGGDLKDLTSSLQAIQQFNVHYLEFDVVDANGRLVASSEALDRRPAPDRIGTAFNLDGKPFVSEPRVSPLYKREVVYVGVPVQDGATVTGALGAIFDIQTVFEEVVRATKFNESGYAVIVGADGHVLAHPDPKRIDQDLSHYPAVIQGMTNPRGELVAPNAAGLVRRFMFRQIRNPQTVDPKPWVLLTEINESEALRPLTQLRDELAAGVAVIVALGLVIAWNAARSLGRPLATLEHLAHAVQTGDLTRRSQFTGRDAFARLGQALDNMIKGLLERDHVKNVFGKYIAKQAAEQLLSGPLDLGGTAKNVTILFSDIRGFTSMAETMTPEQVVSFLNDYFSEMVEAVIEQGGILDKYLGDGMMAVFGSFGEQPDHARRAVLAGLRMKALLAKINGERAMRGKPPVEIGIGIHSGDVIVGNIGSKQRLEFTHIGDGVNTASRVQALNKEYHTTLLVTGATYDALGGTFTVKPVGEVTLRGKTRSMPIYEVVSSAATPAGV
jgi:class 3 adenylate cyclase